MRQGSEKTSRVSRPSMRLSPTKSTTKVTSQKATAQKEISPRRLTRKTSQNGEKLVEDSLKVISCGKMVSEDVSSIPSTSGRIRTKSLNKTQEAVISELQSYKRTRTISFADPVSKTTVSQGATSRPIRGGRALRREEEAADVAATNKSVKGGRTARCENSEVSKIHTASPTGMRRILTKDQFASVTNQTSNPSKSGRTYKRLLSQPESVVTLLEAERAEVQSTSKRIVRLKEPSVHFIPSLSPSFAIPSIDIKQEVDDSPSVSLRAKRACRRSAGPSDYSESVVTASGIHKGNKILRKIPVTPSAHISNTSQDRFIMKEVKQEDDDEFHHQKGGATPLRAKLTQGRALSEHPETVMSEFTGQVGTSFELAPQMVDIPTEQHAPIRKRGRPPKNSDIQNKQSSPVKTPQRTHDDLVDFETDQHEEGGRSARRRRKPAAFDDYVSIDQVAKRLIKRSHKDSTADSLTENISSKIKSVEPLRVSASMIEQAPIEKVSEDSQDSLDVTGDGALKPLKSEGATIEEPMTDLERTVLNLHPDESNDTVAHGNSIQSKTQTMSSIQSAIRPMTEQKKIPLIEEDVPQNDRMISKLTSRIDPLEAAMAELVDDSEQAAFEINDEPPALSHGEGTSTHVKENTKPGPSEISEDLLAIMADDRYTYEEVQVDFGEGPQLMYAMIDPNGRSVCYGRADEDGCFYPEVYATEEEESSAGDQIVDVGEVEKSISPEMAVNGRSEREENDDREDEIGDDGPPQLEPEQAPPGEELMYEQMSEAGGQMRYMDENEEIMGNEGEYIQEEGEYLDEEGPPPDAVDLRTVEFNFLDNKNICCGLCGEIVPYEMLMNEHLPQNHPELLGDGTMDLEEIPYESWLRDKLHCEKKAMESGFRTSAFSGRGEGTMYVPHPHRSVRKVSSVRVCPAEMNIQQLEEALVRKMVEKLGRKVRVTLVDKLHAKCGECGSILSLNKKFEIMHLVRHFNAWHPTSHRCSGSWLQRIPQPGLGKPLNMQDFAVVDVHMHTPDNLQCIWCGMFMGRDSLAMHFHEVHAEEIEVPKCRLCIEELVVNARLQEQYGEDFEITMPDECHYHCGKFSERFATEEKMQKFIDKRITGKPVEPPTTEDQENPAVANRRNLNNSRMQYGKRNKPKRNFVMPALRQAVPVNSPFIEALSETQWQCKKCGFVIMAAVMSSGCILHYKKDHPEDVAELRYELCKARLERISDGCMEFVHASLIECLMCQVSFALHRPFNMCRAIRHLQKKHGEMMPENHAQNGQRSTPYVKDLPQQRPPNKFNSTTIAKEMLVEHPDGSLVPIESQTVPLSPEELVRFRETYKEYDFDEVRVMNIDDEQPVYVLLKAGEVLNQQTTNNISQMIQSSGTRTAESQAQYTVGSNVHREIELMEGEKHMIVQGHVIGEEVQEEIYEEIEEQLEEDYSMELVDADGNPVTAEDGSISVRATNYNGEVENYNQDVIHEQILEIEPLEVVREKYGDDENAPLPKEEAFFGRRIYNTEDQGEMMLRPCPPGYCRRVVQLDDHHIMEYFTPGDGDDEFVDDDAEYIQEELSPEELKKWIASQQQQSHSETNQ